MDIDPLGQMTSLMSWRTQQLSQIKMLKAEHQMEMDMIARFGEAVRAAPAPGTGTRVDKSA